MSINAPKVSPSQASEILMAHAIGQIKLAIESADKPVDSFNALRHLPIYLWGVYAASKSSIVKQLIPKLAAHFDKPVGLLDVPDSWFPRVALQECHVDAYGGHREDEPRQRADERHEKLSQIVVGCALIALEGFRIDRDLANLGHVLAGVP